MPQSVQGVRPECPAGFNRNERRLGGTVHRLDGRVEIVHVDCGVGVGVRGRPQTDDLLGQPGRLRRALDVGKTGVDERRRLVNQHPAHVER